MFKEVIANIKRVRGQLPVLYENAFLAQEKNIVESNIKQLSSGKLSTGSKISPPYSDSYAKKKGFKTPDLKATGEFYDSIFVTPTNEAEVLVTSDRAEGGFNLAGHLRDKYSDDIFGVKNEQDIKDRAFEEVKKEIEKAFEL